MNIHFHKRLNPKIWLKDGTLDPMVANVLKNVATAAVSSLAVYAKIPIDVEYDIEDFFICGSNVEYHYRKSSDIDLKIYVKPDRYLTKMDFETYLFFSKFVMVNFIDRYYPKINGLYIDISVTDSYKNLNIYSVYKNKWFIYGTKPTKKELNHIKYRAKLYYIVIKKMVKNVLKDKNNYNQAASLYVYLKDRRIKSWDSKLKNFEPYSLAFSRLLGRGSIRNRLLKAERSYAIGLITGKK